MATRQLPKPDLNASPEVLLWLHQVAREHTALLDQINKLEYIISRLPDDEGPSEQLQLRIEGIEKQNKNHQQEITENLTAYDARLSEFQVLLHDDLKSSKEKQKDDIDALQQRYEQLHSSCGDLWDNFHALKRDLKASQAAEEGYKAQIHAMTKDVQSLRTGLASSQVNMQNLEQELELLKERLGKSEELNKQSEKRADELSETVRQMKQRSERVESPHLQTEGSPTQINAVEPRRGDERIEGQDIREANEPTNLTISTAGPSTPRSKDTAVPKAPRKKRSRRFIELDTSIMTTELPSLATQLQHQGLFIGQSSTLNGNPSQEKRYDRSLSQATTQVEDETTFSRMAPPTKQIQVPVTPAVPPRVGEHEAQPVQAKRKRATLVVPPSDRQTRSQAKAASQMNKPIMGNKGEENRQRHIEAQPVPPKDPEPKKKPRTKRTIIQTGPIG